MTTDVPHESVLGPWLFVLYINDLNLAIKHCKVHHFADHTNLLYANSSTKKLNKLLNKGSKNVTNWLNAKEIVLNVDKTEVWFYLSPQKAFKLST